MRTYYKLKKKMKYLVKYCFELPYLIPLIPRIIRVQLQVTTASMNTRKQLYYRILKLIM